MIAPVLAPVPVTVIGGYLGAGKTTLVNHLLRNANGLRLAILVNEFGALPIDEDLIEAEGDDIISIAGGCVCCSFGSDLTGALMDMAKLDPRPDHLLIESSGVAIPSAIAGSVSLLSEYSIDGTVIVADAETVQQSGRDRYMGDTVLRQLGDANIIILNKADLVGNDTFAQTKAWLAQQSPSVRIVAACHGAVPAETVLGNFPNQHITLGPHHDTSNMDMLTLPIGSAMDANALAAYLAADELGLIRAKGFVTTQDGQKALIQVVGNRWDISAAPQDKPDGIVCLGFKDVMGKHAISADQFAVTSLPSSSSL